jgi:hypothetical protein
VNPNEVVEWLLENWAKKSLMDMAAEAAAEPTGISLESLRVAEGPRLVVVVCITGSAQIARLNGLYFATGPEPDDWSSRTVADLAIQSVTDGGLCGGVLSTPAEGVVAVVLSTADPRSMLKLQSWIDLPA